MRKFPCEIEANKLIENILEPLRMEELFNAFKLNEIIL